MDLVGNLTVLGAATVTFDVSGDLRTHRRRPRWSPQRRRRCLREHSASGIGRLPDHRCDTRFRCRPDLSDDRDQFHHRDDPRPMGSNSQPTARHPRRHWPRAARSMFMLPSSSRTARSSRPTVSLTSAPRTPLIVDTGANPAGITIAATTSLTLGAGSLTSVSDDGQTVPYGFTQNGDWYYTSGGGRSHSDHRAPGQADRPQWHQYLRRKGAVLDASGGGDFFAGAFVPGTGGSTDIFTKPNVYAVIPGYSGVAPYDPTLSTGSPSLGRRSISAASPGLTAGYYTLLPGQYAELPGAYLVSVQTTPSAKSVTTTQTSIPTTGRTMVPISSPVILPRSERDDFRHWSVFDVMPTPLRGSTPRSTIASRTPSSPHRRRPRAPPFPACRRMPASFRFAATGSLNFQGSGVFTPGTGGLGGLADISASQILVVDSSTANALDALVPGTAAYDAALAAYLHGASVGGAQDVDATATSTSAVTIATGNQTFTTQKNLTNFVPGQSIIVNGGSNNLSAVSCPTIHRRESCWSMSTKTAGSGSIRQLDDQRDHLESHRPVRGRSQPPRRGKPVARRLPLVHDRRRLDHHHGQQRGHRQ